VNKEEILALHPEVAEAYKVLKDAQWKTECASNAENAAFESFTNTMMFYLPKPDLVHPRKEETLLKPSEQAELDHAKDRLGAYAEGIDQRVTSRIAKQFLLDGPYWYLGRRCDPRAKHLGLGVYSLTVKKEPI